MDTHSLARRACRTHSLARREDRANTRDRPGLIMVLHSWGQQVGFHVHVHIILTGGGLSLDKDPDQQRWIQIPRDHPALRADALSVIFKRLFLRRLKEALRRGKLQWPETLLAGVVLPVANKNDNSNHNNTDKDTDIDTETLPPKRTQALRELTADEQDLLRVLGSKHWVTNADPTQADVALGEDGKPRRDSPQLKDTPGRVAIAVRKARRIRPLSTPNRVPFLRESRMQLSVCTPSLLLGSSLTRNWPTKFFSQPRAS